MLRARREFRGGDVQRGIVIEADLATDFGGQVFVRECAVASARLSVREDGAEHLHCRPVGVRGLRDLVCDGDDAEFAAALHDGAARAGLLGFLGVDLRDRVRGLRDRAVVLCDFRECRGGIELADDGDGRIVRPVEGVVKFAELCDRHLLDVAAPADRVVMVRVREERRAPQLLVERVARFVFAALEFIPHHDHLRPAILLAQREIAHPIGLDLDEQRQRVRRDRGKIICAIEPRGCIRLRADALEHLIEAHALAAVEFLRAFEHEVLEQVRRARRPGHFIARADMVGDHESHHRCGFFRQQQNAEAV